jgi:hypothetical protein
MIKVCDLTAGIATAIDFIRTPKWWRALRAEWTAPDERVHENRPLAGKPRRRVGDVRRRACPKDRLDPGKPFFKVLMVWSAICGAARLSYQRSASRFHRDRCLINVDLSEFLVDRSGNTNGHGLGSTITAMCGELARRRSN